MRRATASGWTVLDCSTMTVGTFQGWTPEARFPWHEDPGALAAVRAVVVDRFRQAVARTGAHAPVAG